MAQTLLNSQMHFDITVLPTSFITDYMPYADGNCVKVYLYLLHSLSTSSFSFKKMEETLTINREQSCYALHYWENLGLLSMKMDETGTRLISLTLLPVPAKKFSALISEDDEEMVPAVVAATAPEKPSVKAATAPKPAAENPILSKASAVTIPTLDRVSALSYGNDIEFQGLLHVLQQKDFFNRSFLPKEADTIARIFHGASDNTEAVLLLSRYCLDHFSSFSDKRVNILKKAEELLEGALSYIREHMSGDKRSIDKQLKSYLDEVHSRRYITEKFYTKDDEDFAQELCERFIPGMAKNTTQELNQLHYWRSQFGPESFNLILHAADKTRVKAINCQQAGENFSHFAYLDSLLQSWKDAGLHTLAEVEAEEEKYRQNLIKEKERKRSEEKRTSDGNVRPAVRKDYNDFPQHTYDHEKAAKSFFNQIFEEAKQS